MSDGRNDAERMDQQHRRDISKREEVLERVRRKLPSMRNVILCDCMESYRCIGDPCPHCKRSGQ